jgi:glycosyltransferase involved in cell wall biosynthesis
MSADGVLQPVPRPLRVTMVCNGYLPHFGGLETHVAQLVDALAGAGVVVEVLTQETDRGLPAVETNGAVTVRRFRSVVPSQRDAQAPGLWAWIARRRSDCDVMHFHSYHALLSAAALVAGPPIVFTPHYHGTGHSPLRAALHRAYGPVGRRIFERSAAVICVSEAEAAIVRADFPGVADRVRVVPNGVDAAEMRRAEPVTMTAPYFLSLGRLERYKRVDRVIEAMALVPEPAKLVVVGTGPARPQLSALAGERGLMDRVVFVEDLPRSQLRGWLAGAQAVVSMSEHEAFGLTLLEGLAAGSRVVASDLPAHREVGAFGRADAVRLLAPTSAPAQLAAALRECLGTVRDVDRGARVPSWPDVGRQTGAVYREVIGGRRFASDSAGGVRAR